MLLALVLTLKGRSDMGENVAKPFGSKLIGNFWGGERGKWEGDSSGIHL